MYRKYNKDLKLEMTTIFPGEVFVTKEAECICTVLGSCVSVCMYDPINGVSGMNHFMLPKGALTKSDFDRSLKDAGQFYNSDLRYGTFSMEYLIGEMQKKGADRKNLKAKIFGGGDLFSFKADNLHIGKKNIDFTLAFLELEQIPIVSQDIGKTHGRKIIFRATDHKVFLKRLENQTIHNTTV